MSNNKKEQIFQAVIDHIKKEGLLTNITVAEIAKSADVGKGTVYEYFSSKEEIIAETMIYMIESISNQIMRDKYASLSFEEALRLHIKKVADLFIENFSFHTMLMSQNIEILISKDLKCKIREKIMELQGIYQKYLKVIFNKGVQEGKIKTNEDLFTTVAVSNTIGTSIIYYIQDGKDQFTSLDDYIDKVYHIVVKMLS